MSVTIHAARLLYGPRWQAPLARDMGVRDRSVRRWASGERETPPEILEYVRTALRVRVREIVRELDLSVASSMVIFAELDDPTGDIRQFSRDERRSEMAIISGTKLSDSRWSSMPTPEPNSGWVLISDCFQVSESWWYATEEEAEAALPAVQDAARGASEGPRLGYGAGGSFPPRVFVRPVSYVHNLEKENRNLKEELARAEERAEGYRESLRSLSTASA